MGNLMWIASYPKSGNTWMRLFIENYLQNASRPVDINTIFARSTAEAEAHRFQRYAGQGREVKDLTVEEVCAIRPLVHQDMARAANGTIFVKSHNYLGEFAGYPLHNSGVTSGAIYIVRNPLDVVISLARYFNLSVDEAIESMAQEMTSTSNEVLHVPQIITSWSLNVKSWTQVPEDSVLVLRYEDMLDNPLKVFRKVESFLGQRRDPKRLRKAVRFSSFDQLKSQEKQHGFIEKYENAQSFFRRGRKDQWKDELTEQQAARIIDDHGTQMARFKYLP